MDARPRPEKAEKSHAKSLALPPYVADLCFSFWTCHQKDTNKIWTVWCVSEQIWVPLLKKETVLEGAWSSNATTWQVALLNSVRSPPWLSSRGASSEGQSWKCESCADSSNFHDTPLTSWLRDKYIFTVYNIAQQHTGSPCTEHTIAVVKCFTERCIIVALIDFNSSQLISIWNKFPIQSDKFGQLRPHKNHPKTLPRLRYLHLLLSSAKDAELWLHRLGPRGSVE